MEYSQINKKSDRNKRELLTQLFRRNVDFKKQERVEGRELKIHL